MRKFPLMSFVPLAALLVPGAFASEPAPAPTSTPASAPAPNPPQDLTPAPDQLPLKNFYPAKGQTPEQHKIDTTECNRSAVSSSGYNPAVYQAAGEPQQTGVSKFQKAMRACMKERGYTVQ